MVSAAARLEGLRPVGPVVVGSGAQESVVDGLGCRAGRDAEFVAQRVVELGIDAECFGDVSLGCECLHEKLESALPQRDEAHEPAAAA